ncbi:hypothetical protein BS50DRAFT_90617 [Corynespora cassiicola Philippines]|uniref:Uncharacterized protein n=1 Tax=Corynespora cassiicola Philippines TaxID=1448308 RepID=A0A2T2NEQ6_CORCC|nr:hypothetical protein BS50DRAFT_90617 [Corynespora cassiicola Philippines]
MAHVRSRYTASQSYHCDLAETWTVAPSPMHKWTAPAPRNSPTVYSHAPHPAGVHHRDLSSRVPSLRSPLLTSAPAGLEPARPPKDPHHQQAHLDPRAVLRCPHSPAARTAIHSAIRKRLCSRSQSVWPLRLSWAMWSRQSGWRGFLLQLDSLGNGRY